MPCSDSKMDNQAPTSTPVTMPGVMSYGLVTIATLILSFVAQLILTYPFDFRIGFTSTVLTFSALSCLGYGVLRLVREVLARFNAWLRTCVDQTLKQTFVTTDQVAEAKQSLASHDSLRTTLSEYSTKTEVAQKDFIQQTEFASQLDQHLDNSKTKQYLDKRFQGQSDKTVERCNDVIQTVDDLSAKLDTRIENLLHGIVQNAHEAVKNGSDATLETIHNNIAGDRIDGKDMNTRLHNRFDRLQNETDVVLTTLCDLIKACKGPSEELNQTLKQRCDDLPQRYIEGHFEALLDHLSDTAKGNGRCPGRHTR